ncbi:MAG: PaaI family thioesterase [Acidimicrobiales bacterium]
MSRTPGGAPVGGDGPRRRLAAALRPVITMTVAGLFDDQDMAEAAEALEAVSARMAGRAGPERKPRLHPDISRPPQEFFPTSPVTGLDNPLAAPVRVEVVDGAGPHREILAEAWFDYPYEGPPTCVHGGVIAQTFDELLGAANMVAGYPGMTGTLTVRYRKPTPLRTPLRIEARYVSRAGRKVHTWAAMYDGDLMTAEAEGIFIEVAPTRFLAIAEGNAEGADPTTLEIMRTEAQRVGAASDVPGFLGAPDVAD